MKKVFASVLALGIVGIVATGCKGGLPGAECKFNKGEVAANVQGEAKAFLDAAMDLKKSADALEAEFQAEIKAMAGELKVEQASEDAVLAKINANITAAKAKGECKIDFKMDVSASASGSADASGKAATGEGASGSGSASGNAKADVKVTFKADCKVEGEVKANLDITTASIQAHYPKLLSVSVTYKDLLPKVKDVAGKLDGAIKAAGTDFSVVNEVKCAGEAVTGIKADARVEFSVKAEASAKGEAKAG